MRTKLEKIKVYLEGVEFPYVNNITVTESTTSSPVCEITTTMVSRIMNLLPKTLCHIFYEHDNQQVLIFEGELSSVSFDRSTSRRVCKLTFMSLNVNLRQYYLFSIDLSFKLFDTGAFIVSNTDLGFTYDGNEETLFNFAITQFDSDKYLTIKRLVRSFQNNNTLPGTSSDIFRLLTAVQSYQNVPMPLDYMLTLLCMEASTKDEDKLIFSVNTSRPTYQESNFFEGAYGIVPTSLENLSLTHALYPYYFPDKNSPPTTVAWGLFQQVTSSLRLTLSSDEVQLVQTGILFPKLVEKVDNLGLDSKTYYDKDGFMYPVPSTKLLIELQSKASGSLFEDKLLMGGVNSTEYNVSNPYVNIHPQKLLQLWHHATEQTYPQQAFKFFQEVIKDPDVPSAFNDLGPLPTSSELPNDLADNSKKYVLSNSNDLPNWIKTIIRGGSEAFTVKSIISTGVSNRDLKQIVDDIYLAGIKSSTYFASLSKSIKLDSDRIFIVDDENSREILSLDGMSEYMLGIANSQGSSLTSIYDTLRMVTYPIGHDIIEWSIPSSGLITTVMIPDTTFMPPILPNIFFPDQINDLQYSRDFMSEPTRLTGFTNTVQMLTRSAGNASIDMKLGYITPKIPDIGNTTGDNANEPKGMNSFRQYTFEECWRGINAHQSLQNDTPFEELVLRLMEYNPDETVQNDLQTTSQDLYRNPIMSGMIDSYWKSMIDGVFLKKRYATRTVMLTTDFNPSRMCGFPALVLDKDFPSIIGKIQSITTSISADGQAISQISLSHCHTHWDSTLENIDGLTVSGVYNYAQDAVPSTNHVWKWLGDSYSWFNIGTTIYSKLLVSNELTDYSIFSYLSAEELTDFKNQNSSPMIEWISYAKALSKAIKNLKNKYYKVYKHDRHKISDNVIKRPLVTYADYWLKLIGTSSGPKANANYRPATMLQEIQKRYLNSGEYDLSRTIGRPFIYERYRKVQEMLGNTLPANPNEVING